MRSAGFARGTGSDRKRVNPGLQEVAEGRVDRALAFETGHAGEGRGFDFDREMAFAGAVMAGMAPMPIAVVDDPKQNGIERGVETSFDFCGDWAG